MPADTSSTASKPSGGSASPSSGQAAYAEKAGTAAPTMVVGPGPISITALV